MMKTIKSMFYYCMFATLIFSLLTGCKVQSTAKKFHATDITGVEFGKDFNLTDHHGKPRSLADFKGKVVVMFFGYTHCPDVCPTTMSEMSQVLTLLGKDADKVQVLFITVDPVRDTPELLAKYVPAFNPTFLGLYGSEADTAKVAKEFKIFYQKHKSTKNQSYEVDHTAGTYVFDQAGKLRLFMSYGQGAKNINEDIKNLLAD